MRAGVVVQLRHSQKTIKMAKEAASRENKHGKSLNVHKCVCDLHNVSRLALSSVDMEQRDYDLRTALHVAAAEGETLQKKQTTLDGTFYSAKIKKPN